MQRISSFARLFLVLQMAVVTFYAKAQVAQWDTLSLPRVLSYVLARDSQGRIFCGGDSVVRRSTDNGITWNRIGVFRSALAQSMSVDTGGAIYFGNDALGIFRSTDDGTHWSTSIVTEGCNTMASHPVHGILFAGLTYTGNGKVHRSTNQGNSWTGIALPNASGSFATQCFAFGSQNEVYAGTVDGFYRSTDYGVTWAQRNSGLGGRNVNVITVTPEQHIVLVASYTSTSDGLYRSTDHGDSWQRLSTSISFLSALIASPAGELFGTNGSHIYKSSDEGSTWTDITGNVGTSQQIASLTLTPDGHLLAGGYRLFRSRTTPTRVANQAEQLASYRVMQNYPNPFNPATTIRFQLPHSSRVSLRIFNTAGQIVSTLADENLEAGTYERTFDGQQLASGVYLYRLQTGDFTNVKKLVLLK